MRRFPCLLLAVVLLAPSLAVAGRPTMPEITDKQAADVAAGKLVLLKETIEEGGAVVTGLLEIETTPAEIWPLVLNNDHIIASSSAVKECVTYHDVLGPDGLRDLRLAFMMKVGWSEIRFHSWRTVNTAEGWMSWELDPAKDNDIKSTIGSYSVWPGSQPGHILFVYKARIETGKRVPEWLEEELTESSLKKFLKYIKDVAEE